ncbi:PilZ domain-containing protein [Sphingomonas sp. LT1P40]|uniref:PilZ domain-containing protein n=1 Tax=Alteristakelama amylovorans TaxID=3096166 RepID=UPI002FC9D2FF
MHIESKTTHALASISASTEPVEDRRSGMRVQTVFKIARVDNGNDQGFARVQNISDDGVRLRMQLPVCLGDRLVIELAENVTINGRVVWTDGADCGLQLDEQIDSPALLGQLALQARAATARPLRLKVATSALSRGANGTRVVEVADVSQRGMKLIHDGSFCEGLQVKITLPSGIERRGVVRWSQDRIAGVMFLEPFTPNELGSVRKL